MNKYTVSRFEKKYDPETQTEHDVQKTQTIEADKAVITSNGDLKLSNKQGGLIRAYARGFWDMCELIEPEPTPEQSGAIQDGP